MSGTPPSSSPLAFEDEVVPITRTLAIIKTHALHHRLAIEQRILAAQFEIVKERQMEFDPGSDQDFLNELFGVDTPSLFEGPVWVYILERQHAAEAWNILIGDADPAIAHDSAPHSLRALFGINPAQNALIGAPDAATAEEQIACLFASSPPFPPADMPTDDLDDDQVDHALGAGELTSGEYSQESGALTSSEYVRAHDVGERGLPSFVRGNAPRGSASGSSHSGSTRTKGAPGGQVPFKARPLPATTFAPSIQPRTTRAAALRAGVPAAALTTPVRPRTAPTKAQQTQAFMDVPGHKRSETISVASTAAPAIAPRMTRAASLRLGKVPEAPVRRPKTGDSANGSGAVGGTATFEGVPGHKRRESIAVASVKAPTVAPRLNKSAALRAQKDAPPPSSYMFRTAGTIARTPSQTSTTSSRSASAQASHTTGLTVPAPPRRPSSVTRTGPVPVVSSGLHAATKPTATKPASATPRPSMRPTPAAKVVAPPAKPAPKPRSSVAPAPAIAPRTNRSALLRASMGVGNTLTPAKKPVAPRLSIAPKAARTLTV